MLFIGSSSRMSPIHLQRLRSTELILRPIGLHYLEITTTTTITLDSKGPVKATEEAALSTTNATAIITAMAMLEIPIVVGIVGTTTTTNARSSLKIPIINRLLQPRKEKTR